MAPPARPQRAPERAPGAAHSFGLPCTLQAPGPPPQMSEPAAKYSEPGPTASMLRPEALQQRTSGETLSARNFCRACFLRTKLAAHDQRTLFRKAFRRPVRRCRSAAQRRKCIQPGATNARKQPLTLAQGSGDSENLSDEPSLGPEPSFLLAARA